MSRFELLLNTLLENGELPADFVPQTRFEHYLVNCVNKCGCEGAPKPQTVADALLYRLAEEMVNSGGGSGEVDIASAIIDKSITSIKNDKVTIIGKYAFNSCELLTEVEFKNVKEIGNFAFQSCTLLEKVVLPKLTTTESSTSTFAGCTSLKDFYAPLLNHVAYGFFNNCSKLESISLPSATIIGSNAFSGCTTLKDVSIPLVEKIEQYTFYKCTSLESISLPLVTSFSGNVFNYCSNLVKVIIESETVATLSNTNSFNNTPIASGTGYIYVPDDLVDSYKAATNWSTYAAQIKGLSELEA